MNKIEAVVDAIAYTLKAYQGDSLAYTLRNPILLRSYARPGKHQVDEEGHRIFDSYLGGYKAAVWDVELKLNGNSNCGLTETDRLRNLLGVLGLKKEEDILSVVYFLRKSLQDPSINQLTPLSYFRNPECKG